jgi:sugar O-acyltransferase (sialic acid O-acetyltransferase NeuD family)
MKRLAIIACGELGLQVAHFASQSNEYTVVGWFDDLNTINSLVIGCPVIGKTDEVLAYYKMGLFDEIFIAIGYNHLQAKKRIYDMYEGIIPFATIIHKSCIIDSTAKIGNGVIIYPGTIIDKEVLIFDNVLINLGCVISHNTTIQKHCFVAPSVNIAGFVTIGESSFLSINCTIIDNISIPASTVIGAGATVVKNIEFSGVYVGTPAYKLNK